MARARVFQTPRGRVDAESELNSVESELNAQRWKINAQHAELDHDARGSFRRPTAGGDTRRSIVLSSSNVKGTSIKQKAPAK